METEGHQTQLSYFSKTPQVGFEPTTNRLTADRSTTELLRITREAYLSDKWVTLTTLQMKNFEAA
jgi:hypothetical protein